MTWNKQRDDKKNDQGKDNKKNRREEKKEKKQSEKAVKGKTGGQEKKRKTKYVCIECIGIYRDASDPKKDEDWLSCSI